MTRMPDDEAPDLRAEPPERPASEPELPSLDTSPFAEPQGVWLQEGAQSPEWLVDAESSPFTEPDGGDVEEEEE
jgi:hypothetical protein